MLDQVGHKLVPSWLQVGPKMPPVGSSCPSWPKLAPSWPRDGLKLASRCPQVGPSWLMLAPTWLHDGPSLKVSPRLDKASTKPLPLRPGFSKMSTKALPQAFRRLIVLSGCSIFLLSILKVVSFWSFFQLALSWQVFQNDLFKRSSQVVLVGSSCLKFHPFSCIARRHCVDSPCSFDSGASFWLLCLVVSFKPYLPAFDPLVVLFWRFFLVAPSCDVFQNEISKRP